MVTGVLRTDYGVHFPSDKAKDCSLPLDFRVQSVQRAELMATCKAVEISNTTIIVVSDSQYVVQALCRTQRSRRCPSKHSDLWAYLLAHIWSA